MNRINVYGVEFENTTAQKALDRALELIENKSREYIVTPNPEIVMVCRKNKELNTAVKNAAMVLPDGIGIMYGAKILGTPLNEKIAGCDFGEKLIAELGKKGKSVYFFGAKPEVAKMAAENLKNKYEGLVIAGYDDGYFTDDTDIIKKINEAKPDLLLVCLGSPKQELWMAKNCPNLGASLSIGLGGSLDVWAGVVERAPEKWQKLGLEWLYRLKCEPKRIKRMGNLPKFGFGVIGARIFKGKNK